MGARVAAGPTAKHALREAFKPLLQRSNVRFFGSFIEQSRIVLRTKKIRIDVIKPEKTLAA
jgi:hypothetical protein